jgi:hypothetical protein
MKMTYQKLNYKGLEKRIKETQIKMIDEVKTYGENYEEYYQTKEFKKKLQKIKKAIYLKEKYHTFEQFDSEHLVNFYRQQEDFDSWYDLYIFNTTDLEIVKNELEEMYVEVDGSSWTSDYDCTGRAFFRACNFYQLENRTFVTQSGGLDV